MAVERRYVHQFQVINGPPCDARTKHWTEVKLTADDLAEMIGCAPGSTLISFHAGRDGNLTITVDEHRESNCLNASSALPSVLPGEG